MAAQGRQRLVTRVMVHDTSQRPHAPWPFTDAVVTLAFTKYNIYNYISRENWSRQHVLELAVGDVITDVELPPPDFLPPTAQRTPFSENGWYQGLLKGRKGMFSSNYVQFRYLVVPLTVDNVTKAVENVDWLYLFECVYMPGTKKQELYSDERSGRKELVSWWLLNDPAPSWRRLIRGIDFWSCDCSTDTLRHLAEEVRDTTFTLTNVLSTLETVQEWNKLGDKLHVPYTKQDSKDTMMNYYVTSIANASWQMLAGALYYCGEQTALKKVKAYFQRQREPTLTIANLNAALEEVELDDLCGILNVPHLRHGRTKQAIIEDFFQNHPAPSWRIIADHLYMYSNNGYGKYHAALQVVKLKYLKDEYYLSICEQVMHEHGAMDQTIMHCIFVGPAGAGKSSLLKRLLQMRLDPVRTSTQIAEKSVRVEIRKVSTTVAQVSGLDWQKVENPISQASGLLGQLSMKLDERTDDSIKPPPGLFGQHSTAKKTVSKDNYPTTENPSQNIPEQTGNHPEVFRLTTSMIKSPQSQLPQHSQFSKTIDFFRHVLKEKGVSRLQQHFNTWTLYLTDSGGQPEFQELLPALAAGPCVFFVVFPLNKDLNSKYEVEYVRPNEQKCMQKYFSSLTVLEDILRSLASIASTKYEDKDGRAVKPRVMLVATFKDRISQKDGQKRLKELQNMVKGTEAFRQGLIVAASKTQIAFTINNACDEESQKDSKEIRDAFLNQKMANEFKVCTPTPWLIFSILFQHLHAEDSVISKQECFQIAEECGIPEFEFEAALQFLHKQTGMLHYYTEPSELSNIVIRDPQYLFSRVNQLVEKTFTFEETRCIQRSQDFERGIFRTKDLEMLAKEHNHSKLVPSMLLKLLEHLNVIVPLDDDDKRYFMPCAIAHLDDANGIGQSQSAAIPPLLITFKSGYCPKGLFGALVACIVNKQVQANCTLDLNESQIRRDEICFTVGLYQLRLRINPTHIYIELVPSSTDTLLSTGLCTFCNNIRRLIESNIIKACKMLNYSDNANYQLSFVCQCDQKQKLHPAQLRNDPIKGQFLLCTQSNEETISVKRKSYVWLPEPTILLDPVDQLVAVEAKAVFRVEATGDNLHFQWQKNRTDLSDGGRYCDTDTDTLCIVEVEKDDKGRYRCVVENSVGKQFSKEASLTVEFVPPTASTPRLDVLQPIGSLAYPMGFQHPSSQQLYSGGLGGYQTFVPFQPLYQSFQNGASVPQNVYQQQPPYEQDPHMQLASQVGGPGQQQSGYLQPWCGVQHLPLSQKYYTDLQPQQLPSPEQFSKLSQGLVFPNPKPKELMHLQVSDWNRLGLALDLESYDLDIIGKDHRGDTRTQTLKMFQLWLKKQPDASYEQLIKALNEVGDERVASFLCKKFGVRLPPPETIDARSEVHQSTMTQKTFQTQTQHPQIGAVSTPQGGPVCSAPTQQESPTSKIDESNSGVQTAGAVESPQTNLHSQVQPHSSTIANKSDLPADYPDILLEGSQSQQPLKKREHYAMEEAKNSILKPQLQAVNVLDNQPTLIECVRFRGKKRRINIPQEVGTKYYQFGLFLLEDDTGARIDSITHKHINDAEQINMEVLQQWVAGRGRHPVTWTTLTQVLYNIELTTLARGIEAVKCQEEMSIVDIPTVVGDDSVQEGHIRKTPNEVEYSFVPSGDSEQRNIGHTPACGADDDEQCETLEMHTTKDLLLGIHYKATEKQENQSSGVYHGDSEDPPVQGNSRNITAELNKETELRDIQDAPANSIGEDKYYEAIQQIVDIASDLPSRCSELVKVLTHEEKQRSSASCGVSVGLSDKTAEDAVDLEQRGVEYIHAGVTKQIVDAVTYLLSKCFELEDLNLEREDDQTATHGDSFHQKNLKDRYQKILQHIADTVADLLYRCFELLDSEALKEINSASSGLSEDPSIKIRLITAEVSKDSEQEGIRDVAASDIKGAKYREALQHIADKAADLLYRSFELLDFQVSLQDKEE